MAHMILGLTFYVSAFLGSHEAMQLDCNLIYMHLHLPPLPSKSLETHHLLCPTTLGCTYFMLHVNTGWYVYADEEGAQNNMSSSTHSS